MKLLIACDANCTHTHTTCDVCYTY